MSKKFKREEEQISIQDFLIDSNYDISVYEVEKMKRKERREQKRKKDRDRNSRFIEDYC